MSATILFPYRTADGCVSLELAAQHPPGLEPEADGSFKIFDEDIPTVTMSATIRLDDGYKQEALAPEERNDPPVEVKLVLTSVESRRRETVDLEQAGGMFQATIEFPRDQWIGKVEVQAILVRSTNNPQLPDGFATDYGARLASSDLKSISFDESTAPPGRTLVIQWAKFDSDDRFSQDNRGHLFALQTTDSPPTLYLNENFPHAYTILNSQATTGPKALVRNETFNLILHQAWSSLIAMCIAALREEEAHRIDELSEEWQQTVLKDWAPFLFPGHDPGDAITKLEEAASSTESIDKLLGDFPRAIQSRFKTFQGFEGLHRLISGE